ncbi:MAG: hypothetical protein COU06_02360 [Candidatus Harrisonbacteria bacterium CG10_big_fil_rev_8_21_14_0_10_38_8]|uniref:RNA polymerase sigma factor n=1 Tax=Candidatus Harrisonbacteria bacterium CG10_big_fil_rev_8_21_14_0_10_38_8 TaxID=1974582 RepID=A0A2M6WJQ1_9BACT|nr:MAG: hypothetical protein COU06_02360 [Candidatus Harrisonbacteria bacterium CG10_big_fil_rev_8_21_14_0_10_38_8]
MNLKEKKQQRILLTLAHKDYAKGMSLYSAFKVSDKATGEDLVQDTFIKTWKYLVRGGRIEIMKAFLYHILNQLIIDEYRKHKIISLDSLLEKGYQPGFDKSKHMLDLLDGKTAIILIQSLPVKYQTIMRMRYIQDLSLTEISLITGQSKNTVSVQVHRGVAKLKILFNSK